MPYFNKDWQPNPTKLRASGVPRPPKPHIPASLDSVRSILLKMTKEEMALPRSTRQNLIRPDESLDPVLRHHLKLDDFNS